MAFSQVKIRLVSKTSPRNVLNTKTLAIFPILFKKKTRRGKLINV